MLKIALTGNIGSGKSTVAKLFEDCGFYVYDADKIIKDLYREKGEVYEKVIEVFGREILSEDNSIDTKKLADIVFSDRGKLKILEDITHSALYRRLDEVFKTLPKDAVAIVEASLVLEKKTKGRYDFLVLVYAPYDVCKLRSLAKGITQEDFERRWKNQMDPEEKLKRADYVVDNSGDLKKTKERVAELCKLFKNFVSFQP
ncbi:dephospho-CoA kinase [Thermocrinis sp.]|uniref:dephospho-CoA kinase n=1 Tax=Thermocrinis sp. TaxID=2024383 RepID=UPI002FDCB07B